MEIIDLIKLLAGGLSFFGFTVFEIRFGYLRNKISQYRLKREVENESFTAISEKLGKISDRLNNNIDIEMLWSDLQTIFNHKHFHRKIMRLHNKERDEGKKLVNDIVVFAKKKFLCKNDIESLNIFANEFQLLDRFNKELESPEKRKLLFSSFLAGGAIASTGIIGGSFVLRPKKVRWQYVSFTHKKKEPNGKEYLDLILAKAMLRLAELLNQMSEGEFIIEQYKEAINASTSDSLLTLISNSKEVNCGIAGIYFSQTNHGLYFGTGIPFGLNPEEQTAWLAYKRESKNETFMEEVYEKYGYNILPIPLIATSHQMGGFFPKEINDKEDLAGIAMRIPGLGGNVLHKMHEKFCFYGGGCIGEIKPIHASDIPDLINNNKINAFEFTGPYDDLQILQRINEPIRKNLIYHYPGWWEPGTTFELQVNRESWEDLSESQQSILRAACAQIYKETLAEYNDRNSKMLESIKSKAIRFHRFNDSFLKEAEKTTEALLDEYAIGYRGENFKFAYDEWKNFKTRIRSWSDWNLQNQYLKKDK